MNDDDMKLLPFLVCHVNPPNLFSDDKVDY